MTVWAIASTLALFGVQLAALGPALADAANPNPTTSGTAAVNSDGTVTANLHGTWYWTNQSCAGRYATDWSVDWWGISTSPTPTNSFALTNATMVTAPGQVTRGTVTPAAAIPIPGGTYFHVGRYYSGESVNSSSTCTDVGKNSQGSWTASATYPNEASLPQQVCVNMYDPHGKEGHPSTNATDYDPTRDHDNSIQTNKFNPTAGQGFCVQLQVVRQTIAGHIYSCPGGTPSTTEVPGGTLAVSRNGTTIIPAQPNPLGPANVDAGTYTMTAGSPSGYHLVACNGVTSSSSQTVTVPSGGSTVVRFYVAPNATATGWLEICKQQSGSGLENQLFRFNVQGRTVTVPVGACSAAFQVTAGQVTIVEQAASDARMVGASTTPSTRLVSTNLSTRTIVVRVVAGGISTQTIVTVTNQFVPGNGYLKVCKVAGSGIAVGTQFTYTAGGKTVRVPAGPGPGGYCVVVGQFSFGNVTVTESIPSGDRVSSIAVAPSGRKVSSNLTTGTATVTIGSGVTEVTYTNVR